MNSWSETISLPKPLRDVFLSIPNSASAANPDARQDPWQAGYEAGKIDGEKAMSEQLLKQRAETNELFHGVLTSLREAVPQVIRDTEGMMVSLSLEVAQKIVANMPISAAMVEAAVQDALTQVEGSAQVTVRLHPADLELLQTGQSPLLGSGDGAQEFRFLGSAEVTRGGCLVQTRFGTVDARRETKFDLIKRNLTA
jgi:flagellar assembly protein FliH